MDSVSLVFGPVYLSAQQIVIRVIVEVLALIPSLLLVQIFRLNHEFSDLILNFTLLEKKMLIPNPSNENLLIMIVSGGKGCRSLFE